MNYIINPQIFYWMEVLDSLKALGLVIAILVGIATICVVVWYYITRVDLVSYSGELDEDDKAQLKPISNLMYVCVAVFAVSILMLIFIPSKQTMMEMLIARYATYENAEWTVESLKSVVDYIVEAFKAVK